MVYADIKNLDSIPEATEEEKDMFRKLVGQELDCSIKIEGSDLMFVLTDIMGGTIALEDLPPIQLDNGVFTSAQTIEEDDLSGRFNLYGVVTEEGEGLKAEGELTMNMDAGGVIIEFIITYSVSK